MAMESGRVLYVVRTWVPEEQLEEWNQWHNTVHVPEVVEQPQIKRARKYRVLDDSTPAEWPAQYITVYELDSVRIGTATTQVRRLRCFAKTILTTMVLQAK